MEKKMDKMQLARKASQLIFLGLLFAGLYMNVRMVIMVLLPATFLFGNFFCGWVCPYGTMQEIMGMIGRKVFKKQYKMPRSMQKYMQFSRYILFVILIIGVLDTILVPINGYMTMMGIFSEDGMSALSTIAMVIMGLYLVVSLVFERVFCNYLCTEAAKYGVISQTRIFSIKRDEEKCIDCKKCDKACPMNIEVSMNDQVRNGQCINCMKCIHVCPVEDTLKFSKVPFRLPVVKK